MNTQTPPLDELLGIARQAAAAGAAVLAGRDDVAPAGLALSRGHHGIETKSSASDFVTDFDRRAEQAVREVLTSHRPHDVISGEEYGTTDVTEPSGFRWSIDPLDGTTNFVRGIIYYGTSVGLQSPDGEWIVGAVEAPGLGRSWWAGRGTGAFTSLSGGEPVRISGPSGTLESGILATGFGYEPERRAQQVASAAAMNERFGNLRRLGAAALDICLVADGTLNAYAEYGIQEHDWAAGAVIAEEAGVHVHRPAAADGDQHPDWCLVGDIGLHPSELTPAPSTASAL